MNDRSNDERAKATVVSAATWVSVCQCLRGQSLSLG